MVSLFVVDAGSCLKGCLRAALKYLCNTVKNLLLYVFSIVVCDQSGDVFQNSWYCFLVKFPCEALQMQCS